MPAEAAFRRLLETSLVRPVQLLFGGEPDEEGRAAYRRAPIDHPLPEQLGALAAGAVAELAAGRSSDQFSYVEYDSEYEAEDGEVQYVGLDSDSFLQSALDAFPDPAAAEEWVEGDPQVDPPRSFAVVGSNPRDDPVRFFRPFTAQKEFSPRRGVVALFRETRFTTIGQGRALLFEPSFSCVQSGRFVFILDSRGFERLFNYNASLKRHAMRVLLAVRHLAHLEEYEEFRNVVLQSPSALRKLRGVGRFVNLHTVRLSRLESTIRRFGLRVQIVARGGKRKLILDPSHPLEVLRLLSDSYLQSPLTRSKYLAGSKRRV